MSEEGLVPGKSPPTPQNKQFSQSSQDLRFRSQTGSTGKSYPRPPATYRDFTYRVDSINK